MLKVYCYRHKHYDRNVTNNQNRSEAPRIEIDGQSASPEEVETVNQVLEYVKEGLEEKTEEIPADSQREAVLTDEAEKRTDEPTSRQEASRELPQQKSKTPQERPATIERPGFDQVKANEAGKSFVQHYLNNPNIKQSMQQAGIDISKLSEKMQSGEINVTQETIRAMMDLNRVCPNSEIWRAAPGDGSLLQRAANESRENLTKILSSL